MPVSEAKRRSNQKWDAANMRIVACKVRIPDADRFKEVAKANGTTPNELLKNFVYEYLKNHA